MLVEIELYIFSPNVDGTFSVFLDENSVPVCSLESSSIEDCIKEKLSKYFVNNEWLLQTLQLIAVSKVENKLFIKYSMISPKLSSISGRFVKIHNLAKFAEILNKVKFNVVY